MTSGPRGKKHLIVGVLLLIAGTLFLFSGFNSMFGSSEKVLKEVTINNTGDPELEGNTPRGFAQAGTGLFAGDNINDTFPNTDGVQFFVTFDIRELKNVEVNNARLYSDSFEVLGTPFVDLGALRVDRVSYDTLSPSLWNGGIERNGCVVEERPSDVFACDILIILRDAVNSGRDTLQFRVRFEQTSDRDGEPDLISFNTGNKNDSVTGVLELRVNEPDRYIARKDDGEEIHIPLVVHKVVDSGVFSTAMKEEGIEVLFDDIANVWGDTKITLDTAIVETKLDQEEIESLESGTYAGLSRVFAQDPLSLHMFLLDIENQTEVLGPTPLLIIVPDNTPTPARDIAYYLGKTFSLADSTEKNNLMNKKGDGAELTDDQWFDVRINARIFEQEIERRAELGI